MIKYKVWDTINSSEESAVEVEALSPDEAAETYADEDVDGGIDGIYSVQQGHPLSVRGPDGVLHRYMVTVDYFPQFYVNEVK
jgi:hypothetical protein